MRIRVISITVSVFLYLFYSTDTYSSYLNTNLVYDIKPTQLVRSKPTSIFLQSDLRSIKLASVQFLTDGTVLKFDKVGGDVETQCASLGYVLPVSKCKSPLEPSYLCSAEPSMENVKGASDYTSGCCDSSIYTAASASECNNNATATGDYCYWGGSKKYRCTCDKSRYPYSDLAGESCSSGQVFDVTNVCTVNIKKKEEDGQEKTVAQNHYASCCKVSTSEGDGGYEECDAGNHEVGWGKSCRVSSGGTIKHLYEKCVCSSNYQTKCFPSKLINGEDFCKSAELNDGRVYTRESNCESDCTYTAETNIDSYLYEKAWHCLYEKDGATIKDAEGSLCYNPKGVNTDSEENKKKDENYFDECTAQGFSKSSSDCYVDALILYCPNDSSRVWCLDGKYCSGYDVGKIGQVEACNIGANIEECGSKDQGSRCRYTKEACNNCWRDGQYLGNCNNLDNTKDARGKYLGYSLVNGEITNNCCKFGYYMEDGICKPNVCDKDYYPYALRPDKALGTVEECFEADESANLGYKAYFGYADCNDDVTLGQYWMHDSSNSRKCICNREKPKDKDGNEISGLGVLAFSVSDFFKPNGDSANPGFGEGAYGEYRSCTDPDGSYYGYNMCYIGNKITASDSGKCMLGTRGNYTIKYPYWDNYLIKSLNSLLVHWGYNEISYKMHPRTKEDAYCVHKHTHCEDEAGKKLGTQEVCNMVPEGCNWGYEGECNVCYHIDSVIKNESSGLYEPNPNYQIVFNTYNGGNNIGVGFATCPKDKKRGGNKNVCYGYCKIRITDDSKKPYSCIGCYKCHYGDVLILVDGTKEDMLGVVFYNNKKQLNIHSKDIDTNSVTWDEAKAKSEAYAPTGYENHNVFGIGHWALQDRGLVVSTGGSPVVVEGAVLGEGWGIMEPGSWTNTSSGDQASYRPYQSGELYYPKTSKQRYAPTLLLPYTTEVE